MNPLIFVKNKHMIRGFLFILVMSFSIGLVHNLNGQTKYFDYAKEKMKKYNPKRKDYVIIVDYTKNILKERLYVVLSCRVSHAWNSGVLHPNLYSNQHGSNKTSKGNYITKGTKYGKFGYSMVIEGLDYGINNNARSRAVIFHSDTKMKTKWSNGCFATSESNNKKIIDMTKNGVLVCVID
jgi:hypothetical protein